MIGVSLGTERAAQILSYCACHPAFGFLNPDTKISKGTLPLILEKVLCSNQGGIKIEKEGSLVARLAVALPTSSLDTTWGFARI